MGKSVEDFVADEIMTWWETCWSKCSMWMNCALNFVQDNSSWYYYFCHILNEFLITIPVLLLVTACLIVRGRWRTPMPCICDFATAVQAYHRDGTRVPQDYQANGLFRLFIKRHDEYDDGFRYPPSCDSVNLIVTFMLLYLYVVGIKKLIVFLAQIMNENFTVRVLEYKPVLHYTNTNYFFFIRARSTGGKPTIRLHKSCELQVLRIECTTIKGTRSYKKERSDTVTTIGANGGIDVNIATGLIGGNMGATFVNERHLTVDSTFEREITMTTASVGFLWSYDKPIPSGGLEVKVRLEEDDQVIGRVYFYEKKPNATCEYEFSYAGSRRIKADLADAILEMITELWDSSVTLVKKNKDALFLIFQVVAVAYMVANLLLPLASLHVVSIANSLKDTWHLIVIAK
jgi:hypothetical protein